MYNHLIKLNNLIIGQADGIKKIASSILRSKSGVRDENKPIASFLLLGTTGVGKTLAAKTLAKEIFGGEESIVRIDMSEYMEKFAISRLIGAPPGYVGYEEGGQLSEKVRLKPYSVILLDEVEKAHPDVFNMLLQVLDDGFLTDSLGRKVNFQNTIIIMTSNIGARQIKDFGNGVGFETSSQKAQSEEYEKSVIRNALKKTFSPEFLNRIDDIVIFNSLDKKDMLKIIDIELEKVINRIKKLGFEIKISRKAKEFLVDKGYDKKYGARPLKRAIQKYLEDLIAQEIVTDSIKENDIIKVDLDNKNPKLFLNTGR